MSEPDEVQARLARQAPAGLVELSPDGVVLNLNDTLETLAGASASQLIGTRLRDHLTPASQVIYALKVERLLLETGEVQEVLLELAHRDGRSRPVLFTTRAGSGAADANRYGVLFPAPERRAHERELVKARKAAETAAETRARFLAIVSHELRTPLNGVLGVASLIEASPAASFNREYADIIAQSARRLEAVVDDILDFASLNESAASFEARPSDIAALVSDACDLLTPVAHERGLALSLEIDPQARGLFLVDPRRLRQILRPLLTNAIKFTSQGGVRVRLRRAESSDGATLALSVSDTGSGMDPDDFQRLAAPFEQGDTSSTRRFGGAGLGLAIAKSLVEQMGGRLSVRSTPGQGSCFTVEWQASPCEPEQPKPPEGRPVVIVPPALEDRQKSLRILCAEDDVMNRMLVEALGEDLGHQVSLVEDGAEALQRLETEAFDLVLMDMQMPVMDGLAATRELRRRETLAGKPRLPVIMLTANSMPQDVAAAHEAGVDRHLAKPITAHYLQRAIVETLDVLGR